MNYVSENDFRKLYTQLRDLGYDADKIFGLTDEEKIILFKQYIPENKNIKFFKEFLRQEKANH